MYNVHNAAQHLTGVKNKDDRGAILLFPSLSVYTMPHTMMLIIPRQVDDDAQSKHRRSFILFGTENVNKTQLYSRLEEREIVLYKLRAELRIRIQSEPNDFARS